MPHREGAVSGMVSRIFRNVHPIVYNVESDREATY